MTDPRARGGDGARDEGRRAGLCHVPRVSLCGGRAGGPGAQGEGLAISTPVSSPQGLLQECAGVPQWALDKMAHTWMSVPTLEVRSPQLRRRQGR